MNVIFAIAAIAGIAPIDAKSVQVGTFTDAAFTNTVERLSWTGEPSREPGTLGYGVRPAHPDVLSGLSLNPVEGLIEVWVKPEWNGNDGKRHRLWATEAAGGRQLTLEKSELGFIRAKLTTPNGVTVSRGEVSGWKAGQWHHIAVGWISNKGINVGLPLWIDKWAVDGPVTPYGVFDPQAMPTKLALGDETSEAAFDELIVRPDLKAEGNGMVACVYRDYFRTAPFDSVKIDLTPTRVPTDPRAVEGQEKQFGLLCRRQGAWEPVVENVVRYSQWAYFDAKPLIKWSTSDPSVAAIDAGGKLKALKSGQCRVVAEFHGLKAEYPLTVVSPDKPDLAALYVELLPRFRADAVKDRLAPGETVTAVVHVGNYGPHALPAGAKVRFSLVPRTKQNRNFDPNAKALASWETTLGALASGEETTAEFKWPYPTASTWMKVELDPENKIDEVCKANNAIVELTDARPVHFGYDPKVLKACLANRKLNHVGSFCYYDWIRAEKLRMDVMLREAVFPTTGPNGVEEAYRIDKFTALEHGKWDDEPYNKEADFYDGGFPVNEPVDLMAIDCAIIHEFGHCILSQPDLYGYPVNSYNVFLTDDAGKPVPGSPLMPIVEGEATLASSPGLNVACHVGYASLMEGCQLWLHPSCAGHIMYYRGFRPDRFWGTQGRLIPNRANWLMLTDADDKPLENAAVYVYHVSQAPVEDSGAKYFADRPKFMGQTDHEGRFVFPGETDQDWDDPQTDVVDGTKSVWNPFGTAATDSAFTPNVWSVEGLLLLKIVSGDRTEYQFMDLTQFNTEFLAGHNVCGKYPVRTSLKSSLQPTPLVRKPIPEAIRKVNKAPVAKVVNVEVTVKCGQDFEIDGSPSFDPEGQPLIYRWNVGEGWLRGSLSQSSKLKLTAPNEPKELEYKLWVNDGIRCSEAVTIKVHVVKGG